MEVFFKRNEGNGENVSTLESSEEFKAKLLDFQVSDEQLKKLSSYDSSYWFSLSKSRNKEMDVLEASGVGESMVQTKADFSTFMYKPYDWRTATMNGELVSKVASDAAKQKAVTDFSMNEVDTVLARFQERNKDKLPPKESVSETIDSTLDLGKIGTEPRVESFAFVPGVDDAAYEAESALPDTVIKTNIRELAPESQERVETAIKTIETRKEESKAKLEKMGLGKNVTKSIEARKKLRPGFKVALAVTLAGASLATGGATSIISKGFSAAMFASNEYEKEIEKKTLNGERIKKGRIAIKSLVKGLVLALGTSELLSLVGDAVQHSGMIDNIKEYFTSAEAASSVLEESIPPATPDLTPFDELVNAHQEVPMSEPTLDNGLLQEDLDLPPLEYTIQSGDNFTNIMKQQIFPNFPGAEALTDFQKENMIQNMLKYAAENPADPRFSTIHQFANPNLIHPGDTVDLNQLKEAVSGIYAKFGDTLLGRAQAL